MLDIIKEFSNTINYLMDKQGITEFTMPYSEFKNIETEPLLCEVKYEENTITIKKVEQCK
jgi:hypothetical protein